MICIKNGQSLSQVPFDATFIHNEDFLEARYFLRILQTRLPVAKKLDVAIQLPPEWIRIHNYSLRDLVDHQLEREVIYYFQNHAHINIKEHEFFMDNKRQRAMAVKNTLIQNLTHCFPKSRIKFIIP